ncbi:hypothetical protein K461DRAFT_134330 [Myriangium duriaei CBS 260.36]|uniref:Uncharacterized protein n=1 Tax=Myriangium duriaei CBS 260.36 TaxID=1168546 RepID=A0A9P4J1P7_9PEZI|nr:hypothetical protein K461DRAFT_134330 [Myriangium duriaei CBS 260.36]
MSAFSLLATSSPPSPRVSRSSPCGQKSVARAHMVLRTHAATFSLLYGALKLVFTLFLGLSGNPPSKHTRRWAPVILLVSSCEADPAEEGKKHAQASHGPPPLRPRERNLSSQKSLAKLWLTTQRTELCLCLQSRLLAPPFRSRLGVCCTCVGPHCQSGAKCCVRR